MENEIKKEPVYIDPRYDFGFKRIFGSEEQKEQLIDFLNAILIDKRIVDLEFKQTERGGNVVNRKVFFDLYCTGDKGEHFILEMQRAEKSYFRERCVFYGARAVSDQVAKGKLKNYALEEVIVIGILNFKFKKPIGKGYRNEIVFRNKHFDDIFYDKLSFIFVELAIFKKSLKECDTALDKWLYLLKHMGELDHIPEELNTGMYRRIFEIAEFKKLSMTQQQLYELDKANEIDLINFQREDAEEIGIKKGLAKGRVQGKAEGRVQGRAEGRAEEKLILARKLKARNFSYEDIRSITGLSAKQVHNL